MPTNTTDTLREHQRKAGQAKSEAKAKAARENGKKGGRPRKTGCSIPIGTNPFTPSHTDVSRPVPTDRHDSQEASS